MERGVPHLLKDRALVAHVDARQDAGAARQARHHVGHEVAVQVRCHLLRTTLTIQIEIPDARVQTRMMGTSRVQSTHATPDRC